MVGERTALIIVLLTLLVLFPGCFGTGSVFSTTVWAGPLPINNNTMVLGTRVGRIVAVNVEDGSEAWAVETQAGRAKLKAIYGTPATDGKRVYAGGFDGSLYAMELAAGGAERVAWSYAAGSPFVGGPAVAGGLVLAGTEAGTLYAIEADGPRAGGERWSFQAEGRIWSHPVAVGNLVYVTTLAGAVHAIYLQDDPVTGKKAGEEKWRFTAAAGIAGAPAVADGIVYVGAFDNKLYALDALTGAPRWSQPFEGKNWFWAEPLVHQGRVYAPSMDHNLYVLDAQTGTPVHDPLETGGALRGMPALMDGFVVVANEAGETWWLDIQTGAARAGGGLEAAVYAPPARAESAVYIYAQDETLYRIAPRARQPVRVYPVKK